MSLYTPLCGVRYVTVYPTVWCMLCHCIPTVWCRLCHCIPHCVVYVMSLYTPLCGVCCVTVYPLCGVGCVTVYPLCGVGYVTVYPTVWCMLCHCIPHCVVYVVSLYIPTVWCMLWYRPIFCETTFPQILQDYEYCTYSLQHLVKYASCCVNR